MLGPWRNRRMWIQSFSMDPDLLAYLSEFVTERRRLRMQEVLSERTRYLTVVLEDLYQPHNGSAVLRSCDAFGIQDVHIVERKNRYRTNPDIELGTSQWLTLHRHRGPESESETVLGALRQAGYRTVATARREDAVPLEELDLEAGPIALLFGTEISGLTPETIAGADEALWIPMHGFVESFNISVSVALCLQDLTRRLRSSGIEWALPEGVRQEIYLDWIRKSIKNVEALEARYTHDREG
jgi:tRNA (guanosine-2'-O-)-methyltransferase